MTPRRGHRRLIHNADHAVDHVRLLDAVRRVPVGEMVYAAPASVNEPIIGTVVDVDGVLLALATDDNGVVWVHGADCPDLTRTAAGP